MERHKIKFDVGLLPSDCNVYIDGKRIPGIQTIGLDQQVDGILHCYLDIIPLDAERIEIELDLTLEELKKLVTCNITHQSEWVYHSYTCGCTHKNAKEQTRCGE